MTVPIECFANDAAATTLSGNGGSITSGAGSFVVADGTKLNAALVTNGQIRVRIDNEFVILSACGTGASATATVATGGRGADGSTAASHNDGAAVTPVVTAQVLQRWAPAYLEQPRHMGMLAWPYDVAQASTNGGAGTDKVLYLTKVYLPESFTVTNLLAFVATAGASLTSAQGAVFDGSGNQTGGGAGVQIATTASQTTTWTSTGLKTMALTADASCSLNWIGGEDVWVYLAVWTSGGTPPAWVRNGGVQSGNPFNGALAAASGYRFAQLAAQSSMPTSVTISSLAQSAYGALWLGVS